jgi:mitochondrial inner membrane protease subunit 1
MNLFHASRRPIKLLKNRYAGHPRRLFLETLKGFFLAHLIWDHVYAYSPLEGPSMLPTFEVLGDGVIVDRWYRRGRGIQVGDIVTFDSVVHPGEKVLKRVLGMEGDYVLRDTPESGSDVMIQVSYIKSHLYNLFLMR